MPERILAAKDYTYHGHVIKSSWIYDRFLSYERTPLKKRLALVAGDVREYLHSLMGMWEEVPKTNVLLKSLNKMLIIKDVFSSKKTELQGIW